MLSLPCPTPSLEQTFHVTAHVRSLGGKNLTELNKSGAGAVSFLTRVADGWFANQDARRPQSVQRPSNLRGCELGTEGKGLEGGWRPRLATDSALAARPGLALRRHGRLLFSPRVGSGETEAWRTEICPEELGTTPGPSPAHGERVGRPPNQAGGKVLRTCSLDGWPEAPGERRPPGGGVTSSGV